MRVDTPHKIQVPKMHYLMPGDMISSGHTRLAVVINLEEGLEKKLADARHHDKKLCIVLAPGTGHYNEGDVMSSGNSVLAEYVVQEEFPLQLRRRY